MMHWIWTILIGFAAGFIAKLLSPGGGPSGFFVTALLGIAGAIVASFVGQSIGLSAGTAGGFIASIIGAIALLFVYRLVTKK